MARGKYYTNEENKNILLFAQEYPDKPAGYIVSKAHSFGLFTNRSPAGLETQVRRLREDAHMTPAHMTPVVINGKSYSDDDIAYIRQVVADCPGVSNTEIARRILASGHVTGHSVESVRKVVRKIKKEGAVYEQMTLKVEQQPEEMKIFADVIPLEFVLNSFSRMMRYNAENIPVDYMKELDYLSDRSFSLRVMGGRHDTE